MLVSIFRYLHSIYSRNSFLMLYSRKPLISLPQKRPNHPPKMFFILQRQNRKSFENLVIHLKFYQICFHFVKVLFQRMTLFFQKLDFCMLNAGYEILKPGFPGSVNRSTAKKYLFPGKGRDNPKS